MGIYYNRKNGPLSITLADGTSHFFPPKKRTNVEANLESSPALLKYLKKGYLHKEINFSSTEETGITEAVKILAELPEIIEKVLAEKIGIIEEIDNNAKEEVILEGAKRKKKIKE